jgi:hypothetical protein
VRRHSRQHPAAHALKHLWLLQPAEKVSDCCSCQCMPCVSTA